jgi:hypothetical protein
MSKLININLELTEKQARLLLMVVDDAFRADKTSTLTEIGVNEIAVSLNQIKDQLTATV